MLRNTTFRTPKGPFVYETCLGGDSVHQKGLSCTKPVWETIWYTTAPFPVQKWLTATICLILFRLTRHYTGISMLAST